MILAATFCIALQADANRLPIGTRGEATVHVGEIYDLSRQRRSTVQDIVKAAAGKSFVYLGENHATTAHQFMEAEIVSALVGAGRHVVVGMEMYQRPKQEWLDKWSEGSIEEADFIEKSDWKGQWGFDFSFYRPVFQTIRDNGLPLVGLNVPREWVRIVGKQGLAGLTAEAKSDLPDEIDLDNRDHRAMWDAMLAGSGHPMTGPSVENMYAAQVIWDVGMSDTAIKYLEKSPRDNASVFVVIAGSGHLMYKQGINWRISRRKGGDGVTVIMVQSNGLSTTVSRGIGDFVYVTSQPAAKRGELAASN